MGILIQKGGLLTTVQDRGFFGYQHQGVSCTGAADLRAYETANVLVGNYDGEAALETTIAGL